MAIGFSVTADNGVRDENDQRKNAGQAGAPNPRKGVSNDPIEAGSNPGCDLRRCADRRRNFDNCALRGYRRNVERTVQSQELLAHQCQPGAFAARQAYSVIRDSQLDGSPVQSQLHEGGFGMAVLRNIL